MARMGIFSIYNKPYSKRVFKKKLKRKEIVVKTERILVKRTTHTHTQKHFKLTNL